MIKLDRVTGRCAYPLHKPDSDDLSLLSDVEVASFLAATLSGIWERGYFAGWMPDIELYGWKWATAKDVRSTAFGMLARAEGAGGVAIRDDCSRESRH